MAEHHGKADDEIHALLMEEWKKVPEWIRKTYRAAALEKSTSDTERLVASNAKGELADFKNPDRSVDIPRAQAVRRRVPG